jgi:homocysteine S-methyltransferase
MDDSAAAGSGRISALSAAVLIEQHAGIETLLHYSCRDRSLSRMQSDLLGAHAIGLRNLLILTGEPTRIGDYADATSVLEVDSIGLTNMVARLNRGLDLGGQPLVRPAAFHIGVMANPSAVNLDEEVRRFEFKVQAGAEFAILPTFDLDVLDRFLARIDAFRIPILAGLRPLESVRHAEYLANEVPGVSIAPEYLARMRAAANPERAAAEGTGVGPRAPGRRRASVRGRRGAAHEGVGLMTRHLSCLAPDQVTRYSPVAPAPDAPGPGPFACTTTNRRRAWLRLWRMHADFRPQ